MNVVHIQRNCVDDLVGRIWSGGRRQTERYDYGVVDAGVFVVLGGTGRNGVTGKSNYRLKTKRGRYRMTELLKVLDHGYVRLVDVMGSDVSVVNAARCSYDKSVDELGPGDIRLLDFLAREGHRSPYRHATLQFEVYAPLMIARQWFKYIVGSDHTMDGWNESSRRYITENETYYIPGADEWRSKPANSKQGSGAPVVSDLGSVLTQDLIDHIDRGQELYEQALADGVAPEQARLFLTSYGMYVRWYWTGSLESVAHLIQQRAASDSQFEFQQYAQAVKHLATEKFPHALGTLLKY